MAIRSIHLARSVRAAASASLLAVAACDPEGAAAPAPNVAAGPRNVMREVYVPVGPIIPCLDTIFKANFTSDVLNAYPGAPAIGSWTGYQSAGIIRVRTIVGSMFSKPVEFTQYAGLSGGVSLSGKVRCTNAPSTGAAVVSWRSLVHSSTVSVAAIVLRDNQSRILAALEYRPNGVLSYNGNTVPGVTWTRDIPNQFIVLLDLGRRRSQLFVDGGLRFPNIPYLEPNAANFWRINMELGGTSAQSLAWDDIRAVGYATW